MSYDIAVLFPGGAPERMVSLSYDQHEALMHAADSCGATLVKRASDFYEQVVFEAHELNELEAELKTVLSALPNHTREVAVEIGQLAAFARESGRHIVVLPD